jgi:hypothetical protein
VETPGHHRPSHTFRIAFALPVLILIVSWPLFSQGNCVSISRAGEEKLSTPPGRILTTALSLLNLSPGEHRIETRLELPPGWRNLTPDIPFALAGNRTDIRLLSIAVPGATPSGVYRIHYAVSDNAVPPCRADLTFEVSVEPLRRIDIQLQDCPRYVVSGDSCRATFVLRNLGNEQSSVRLTARGGENLSAVPDSAEVTLKALESRSVSVIAAADPRLVENVKYVLELRAVLGQDTTVAVAASCLLEIVPRVTAADMQFHELPLEVKLRAAGESGQSGGQIEVEGGGTVTDRGTDRVDVLIRTPDIQSRSILGLRDEYRLSYLSEKYRAYLGDRAYELTPLTELARFAFGFGGQITTGDVTAGGFVNQTRFFSPLQKEQAGFVSYGLAPGTSVGVNFLRKEDFHISNVGTVRGLVRPLAGTDVELEYGMSSLDGANDNAYAARVLGYQQWVSYDIRIVHAGPDYGGYYRNVDFKSASVNARPWGNIRIEAFAQDERQNLLDDTLQLVAPRDRFYQFGAGWGEVLAVYYRQIDQRDLLPVPKYDRRESSVQIRSGYSFPALNVYGSIDLGTSREYLLQNGGPLRRYQLSANFRPEQHQSYGFTAGYLREQNLSSASEMETWSGSLNAAITVASRTRILASLYGTRVGPPFEQSYSLVDLSVEYQFPFKHTLSLRGRQSLFAPSAEGKQVAYLVEYSIPLSIPLTRLSGTGVLRGKVEDAVTRGGVQNVVLYAGGATAVTDESGEYLFPSLKPEVYSLTPDLAGAGVDRVTTRPVPFLVTVLGGEEARLDIGVIRSASISGVINVYDFREAAGADSTRGELIEQGKGSDILVELAGRDETLRRFSDNRGRFQFADLRPGDWTLHVSGEGLPEYHYLERDSIRLTILAAEKKESTIRVLPKRRKIQILQEGNIRREPQPPVVRPSPGEEGYRGVPRRHGRSPGNENRRSSESKQAPHGLKRTTARGHGYSDRDYSTESGKSLSLRYSCVFR